MVTRSFGGCGMWISWHLLKTESFPSLPFTARVNAHSLAQPATIGAFWLDCGNDDGLLLGKDSFFWWHTPAAPCLTGVLPARDDHQSGDRDDEDFEFTAADTWDDDQDYAVLCFTMIWCDMIWCDGVWWVCSTPIFLVDLNIHIGVWTTTARLLSRSLWGWHQPHIWDGLGWYIVNHPSDRYITILFYNVFILY